MPRRPRLVVVASTFPGSPGDGTPVFVRDLSLQLSQTFDTVVLVPRVPGAAPRERIGDVLVERFAYFPRRWESLAHGAILENLRTNPLRWLQVPPFFVSEALSLRRLIRRHRPDVLHVHWIVPQGVAALAAARDVPWVVSTLGGDVYALRDPVSKALTRRILRRAAVVTTMNEEMRALLVEAGGDPDHIHIRSLGADIAHLTSRAGKGSQVPGRVLFVGRLVEKKGVAVLLEALRLLPAHVEWSLEVAGDGPLRQELTERAAGLPVTFLGGSSRDELALAYERSSLVVIPSVPASSGDQDGLPTVLLEAMGVGRAVLASDLAGLNEVLVHEETGLLVPPGDVEAWASALARVLSDAALRNRLGEAAALRSSDYTVEACAKRFAELLTEAAHRGRNGPG